MNVDCTTNFVLHRSTLQAKKKKGSCTDLAPSLGKKETGLCQGITKQITTHTGCAVSLLDFKPIF